MDKDLGKKIKEISDEMDAYTLENASNEELMGYLFLVEKMKIKLEKIIRLEEDKK